MRAGLLAVVLSVASAALSAAEISGNATVVDGDTLTIGETRIRLHGIDAPEARQSCRRGGVDWLCGAEATETLRNLVVERVVTCFETDRDQYGRTVAVLDHGSLPS